jgi:hypothetical protein
MTARGAAKPDDGLDIPVRSGGPRWNRLWQTTGRIRGSSKCRRPSRGRRPRITSFILLASISALRLKFVDLALKDYSLPSVYFNLLLQNI